MIKIKRKTQVILWIIATAIGMVGIYIIAQAIVIGTSATTGLILLAVPILVLIITLNFRQGRDGDSMGK